MVNNVWTAYLWGSNKGFSLRVCVDSWVWHETPEEGRMTYQLKCYEYNGRDEVNSPNIVSNEKMIE